jgi:protein phosphatase
MLWIIAGVACLTLILGVGFLLLAREERAPASAPSDAPAPDTTAPARAGAGGRRRASSGPLADEDPGGTTLGEIPPASGIPIARTASEELDVDMLSQEMWLEDDEPSGPVPRILVNAWGSTHTGRKREHNEDAYLILGGHEVYAIADGMGGYAAGEVAAAIAVETLREAFETGDVGELDPAAPRRGAELMAAIQRSNARIREEAATDPNKAGMGTTVVTARFSPGRKRVYVAHVGDSRCYRVRGDEMQQLTVDHTLGNLGITGKAAHKLSRAVGTFERVEVDLTIDEPQPGDHYLLCSDGLYKMVPEAMILEVVSRSRSTEETVAELVELANERGGRDNVTVVLVRIDEPDVEPDQSGEHRLG